MTVFLAANTRAWLLVGGIIVAIVVALVLVDLAFTLLAKLTAKAMHNEKPGGGAMSGILTTFEGFVRPEQQLVQEEREQRKAEVGKTNPSGK